MEDSLSKEHYFLDAIVSGRRYRVFFSQLPTGVCLVSDS